MDPNKTLETARGIVTDILMKGEEDYRDLRDLTEEAENLAEQFLALDEWLTKGGFLPGEWSQAGGGS